MFASVLIIASLVFGGGISYAAEQSLPGDALYPIKVHVNEEVREAIAFSAEEKAEWNMRRAERRLEEAERLSEEGRFDEEARLQVESRFEAHALKVSDVLERLRQNNVEDASVIAARLEVSLRAHQQVLERLAEKANGQAKKLGDKLGDEAERLKELEDDLDDELLESGEESDEEDADEEEESDGEEEEGQDSDNEGKSRGHLNAAAGMKIAAEHKLAEVRRFIEKKGGETDAEDQSLADETLQAAADAIAEGDALFEAEKGTEAFLAFKSAIKLAQEAKVYAIAHKNLKARLDERPRKEHDERDDEEDEATSDEQESGERDDHDEDSDREEEDRDDEDDVGEHEDEDSEDDENEDQEEADTAGIEIRETIDAKVRTRFGR